MFFPQGMMPASYGIARWQRRGHLMDLAPVAELPGLEELDFSWMALTSLRCNDTRVRDLAPLHGMPLKIVAFDPRLLRGARETIRSWTQLENINGLSPREAARRWNLRLESRPPPQ